MRLISLSTEVSSEAAAKNSPLTATVVIATVMTLCFSSYAAQISIQNGVSLTENCETEFDARSHIDLAVNNYSFVCSVTSEVNNEQKRVFYFNAEELDNKASFYLNTIIPIEHTLISKVISDGENRVVSRDKVGNVWLIKYVYIIDGQTFSSVRNFKLARIKSALKGVNAHRLVVTVTKCPENCSLSNTTSLLNSPHAGF